MTSVESLGLDILNAIKRLPILVPRLAQKLVLITFVDRQGLF